MTEKRFYVAESKLIDGYCVFDREKKYAFSPKPRKADCLNDAHTLNEQHETIERLKQNITELLSVDIEEELLKENEQLKQFKQNVFGLIDKNLEKDKHEYEMTYEDYLNGRIEVLEELKKELEE